MAVEYLNALDMAVAEQSKAPPRELDDQVDALDIDRYEAERRSAQQACRVGDERILRSGAFEVGPRPAPVGARAIGVDVDHRGRY